MLPSKTPYIEIDYTTTQISMASARVIDNLRYDKIEDIKISLGTAEDPDSLYSGNFTSVMDLVAVINTPESPYIITGTFNGSNSNALISLALSTKTPDQQVSASVRVTVERITADDNTRTYFPNIDLSQMLTVSVDKLTMVAQEFRRYASIVTDLVRRVSVLEAVHYIAEPSTEAELREALTNENVEHIKINSTINITGNTTLAIVRSGIEITCFNGASLNFMNSSSILIFVTGSNNTFKINISGSINPDYVYRIDGENNYFELSSMSFTGAVTTGKRLLALLGVNSQGTIMRFIKASGFASSIEENLSVYVPQNLDNFAFYNIKE